ncbi:hypothetical protein D3C78_1976770 [compost metagenome]
MGGLARVFFQRDHLLGDKGAGLLLQGEQVVGEREVHGCPWVLGTVRYSKWATGALMAAPWDC